MNKEIITFNDFIETIKQERIQHQKDDAVKLGLSRIKNYSLLFNSPEKNLRFIHIAGTNGKGSTAAFLQHSLQQEFKKVALFSSPHLIDIKERWKINNKKISSSKLRELILKIIKKEQTMPSKNKLTIFELMTLIALLFFEQSKADIVLWETGLGGRLDSTNIVTPLISLITNIGLDHKKYLGQTKKEIAYEKAGIIKKSIPCITCEEDKEAYQVIEKLAKEKKSQLIRIKKNFQVKILENKAQLKLELKTQNETFMLKSLNLLADYQAKNLALAFMCLQNLKERKMIKKFYSCVNALKKTRWDGRFQKLANGLILDSAHNKEGIKALIRNLDKGKKHKFILSFLHEKDWEAMLDYLIGYTEEIYLIQLQAPRALKMEIVKQYLKKHSIKTKIVNIETTLNNTNLSGFVATGSIILIGEILKYYQKK